MIRERIYRRRLRRYHETVDRMHKLRRALGGIEYEIHPDVWEEIAADVERTTASAQRQFERLYPEHAALPKEL